jgi:hypothetical protein
MEYVDSRVARLRGSNDFDERNQHLLNSGSRPEIDATALPARQPAGTGKLQEIDLGPDASRQNVLRTQAAVFGDHSPDVSDDTNTRKVRKRRRQRRTSDDIRRDKMVEAILAESRRMFAISNMGYIRAMELTDCQWIFMILLRHNVPQQAVQGWIKRLMIGLQKSLDESIWMHNRFVQHSNLLSARSLRPRRTRF